MSSNRIAIVGMSLRVPGARTNAELWCNLRDGVESVRTLSDAELAAAGISPDEYRDPRYVRRKGVLNGAADFDARFFGVPPLEARVMDPQHRLFLECAWNALEDAGYGGRDRGGRVGVYGAVGLNTYWLRYVSKDPRMMELLGGWQASVLNDKDFVPTRVSYHLDLRGPSISVNTACSGSLVAVHMACQSLLTLECDMALAGGVTVEFPQEEGMVHREGMVYAPDGHCRAFDADGQGIVDGNGVGIVVLKRLEDAIRDGDTIRAIILGSAVNNDGAAKVGYTAPSVTGQADVIRQALAMADIAADTIGYVEAHGTATRLGDPIEVAALTQAFRDSTERRQFCGLGSIKTNLGHLDTAAGVAGLAKTILCLQHGELVPSLHYRRPNPNIDFAASPFFVAAERRPWPVGATPRRAGVSSLGIGGTNAHVILEEAPRPEPRPPARPYQLLVLSAKSSVALDAAEANLIRHLAEAKPELRDVAYTLQRGRQAFEQRAFVVAGTGELGAFARGVAAERPPEAVFLFPGQGSQHVGMARDLYEADSTFRVEFDASIEVLRPLLHVDLRQLMFSRDPDDESRLRATNLAQPALFVVEYALARLWQSWGIQPHAMIGHSIGEFVAACLAGVLGRDEALRLVAARGRLMAATAPGAMVAINLSEAAVNERLPADLDLAAVNEPDWCVVAGPILAVAAFEARLEREGIGLQRLHTSHAFHSRTMAPAAEQFVREVARVGLGAPQLPYVSNVTGTWIQPTEATNSEYWGEHLRRPVRFSAGLELLTTEHSRSFIEVGPGQGLTGMLRRRGVTAVASLPHAKSQTDSARSVLEAAGRLWLRGHDLDWNSVHCGEQVRRLPLPTYPFERQRYWVDQDTKVAQPGRVYIPTWTRRPLAGEGVVRKEDVYFVAGELEGLREPLLRALDARGFAVAAQLDPARPPQRVVCLSGLASLLAELPSCDLTVVSKNGQAVLGDEPLAPDAAALLPIARSAIQGRRGASCRAIDVTSHELERALELANRIIDEMVRGVPGESVAMRGRHRWVAAFEPWVAGPQRLRKGGRYLVLGDSPVGRYLAATWSARVHETGSEITEAELRQAVAHLGGLDGVVDTRPIDGRSSDSLAVLERVLEGRELDFCLIFSSLAAVTGGAGLADHAAAHAARDALIRRHNQRTNQLWTIVNWDRWLAGPRSGGIGLEPDEALRELERICAADVDQVVVCAGDLRARLEPSAAPEAPPAADARPELSTEHVPPRTALERQVAAIWQELLGLDGVGVDDDFFELGGHSLLATRFIVRLEEKQGARVSISEFFANPTVASLAALVQQKAPPNLMDLLASVEQMSEDEVLAALESTERE